MVLGRESYFLRGKRVVFRRKIISLGKESLFILGKKNILRGESEFFEEKEAVF